MINSTAKKGVFYGWWIVLTCMLLSFYGNGIFYYGFSTLVRPIATELGWSRVVISGAFSMSRLESGVASPLVGFLLDRFGPRVLAFSGSFIMGAALIVLSRMHAVLPFYITFFLVSVGWSFFASMSMAPALIGKWFIQKRGRALGIFAAGGGLSGLLVPVLSQLITAYGWRQTLLFAGIMTWIIVMPLSFLLKATPEQCGLHPDGQMPGNKSIVEVITDGTKNKRVEVDFPVKEAFSTPAIWLIAFSFLINQMTMSTLFVHLISHLTSVGIAANVAALAVTVITVISIFGRAGFGWLSDFVSKKWLIVVIFLLQAAGFFIFAQARQVIHLIPFVLVYAPAYGGAIVVRAAIIGEYYGRKNFGTINGLFMGITMIGGIVGPTITGYVYDTRGSYHLAFIAFAVASILAATTMTLVKRPDLKRIQ